MWQQTLWGQTLVKTHSDCTDTASSAEGLLPPLQVRCRGESKFTHKPLSGEQVNFHYCRFCRPTNNFTRETEWLILFIISASLPGPPNSIPNNCGAVSPIPRNSPMEATLLIQKHRSLCIFSNRMKKRKKHTHTHTHTQKTDLHPCNLFAMMEGDWKYSVEGIGTRVNCISCFTKETSSQINVINFSLSLYWIWPPPLQNTQLPSLHFTVLFRRLLPVSILLYSWIVIIFVATAV